MTRFCWWLADLLSRTLAPDERDAVLGDLAESGDGGLRTLNGVLGLVARRQIAPWKNWRPWLGLFGLALPLGLLIAFNAFHLASASGIYLWILRNHATIDSKTLQEIGLTLRHGVVQFIACSWMLISWSWVSGFMLRTLSRGAIWMNGTAFCLTLASVAFTEMSQHHPYLYSVEGWIFPLTFYTSALPVLLLVAFVVVPLLRGVYRSHRLAVPRLRSAIFSQRRLW